jgi:hypothetical protein
VKNRVIAVIAVLFTVSSVSASEEGRASVRTVVPTSESLTAHIADASFRKQGFLTTKWCAEQGLFADCRLESIVCGEGDCFQNWEFGDKMKTQLVIYVHDDLQYYNIKPTEQLQMGELIEKGINRNLVTIIGKYDAKTNTIIATGFEAPPPPKKSFFKGCL